MGPFLSNSQVKKRRGKRGGVFLFKKQEGAEGGIKGMRGTKRRPLLDEAGGSASERWRHDRKRRCPSPV